DLELIRPFVALLRRQYGNGLIRVLDVGCGNGLNLSMFADEGFDVTGIDISPRMLEIARETGPSAELIDGDYLSHPFSEMRFHGVFAKAIIHLFTKQDALKLLAKVSYILLPGGIFYVTTTLETRLEEGLREKLD